MEEEDVDLIGRAITSVGHAISADAAPGHDETGGTVNSLTEAVMGVTAGLVMIAEAINGLAASVEARRDEE